jgi:hypothetical protein
LRKAGDRSIGWQRFDSIRNIDAASWIHPGQPRHHATAHARVRREIIRAPGQERQFEFVRIHGHLPPAQQRFDRANMIEMAVREDNRFRRAIRSEPPGRVTQYRPCGKP